MPPLLKAREAQRRKQRETLRAEVRETLRRALAELAPGESVFVFGSLVKSETFHARSDVDVAFEEEPRLCSLYRMQAELEDRLRRPVDVMLLKETRLREKIEREGERWTP